MSRSAIPLLLGATLALGARSAPAQRTRPTPGVRSIDGTIRVGDRTRSYLLDFPTSLGSARVPLVFVFHGGGGSAANISHKTGMSDLAGAKGFVVVYPNGTGRFPNGLLTWNAGGCCGYAQRRRVDDVAFIRALLDTLEREYPIDASRVYATGLSNGGMMSYQVACALSDRFAAVAPVSGELAMDCAPSRPVSVLIIHGTADENLPYDGGVGPKALDKHDVKSVRYALDHWLRFDRCAAAPRVDSTAALVHRTYAPCAGQTAVELYTIIGGGHAWPGGQRMSPAADAPSEALDATRVVWEFLEAHPRR